MTASHVLSFTVVLLLPSLGRDFSSFIIYIYTQSNCNDSQFSQLMNTQTKLALSSTIKGAV